MELVKKDKKEKAILVGCIFNEQDVESLEELKELADTAGAEVVGVLTQKREYKDRAYYIGKGKLQELKEIKDNQNIDLVIFNDELTGIQLKNIEDLLQIKIIDRTNLILDIFSKRAKSKEGMLQVELAQLKYRLPRLTGFGIEMSRLGGGIGTRGPGETKLETDKRHIRRRIKAIELKLEEIKRHRMLQRERRKKNQVPVVAIVGYTNAGKSTLLNSLTSAEVYIEDKLFATLDPTARKLILPSKKEVILIDTVGFIRNLPHDLIESFKSTLEEAKYADLLLHVIDITSFDLEYKIKVVENVLSDLKVLDKPILNVFNKSDLLEYIPENKGNNVYISAKNKLGLDNLINLIEKTIYKTVKIINFYFPYKNSNEYRYVKEKYKILEESFLEEGIKVKAEITEDINKNLETFIIF